MLVRSRPLVLLALVYAAPTGALVAQVAGLPLRNAGIGTGIGIAGDIGFPNSDMGRGTAYGLTASAGLGPLGVSASLARWTPRGQESLNSVGGTGNLKIFGGPLVPVAVTLQAGVGYHNGSTIEGGELKTLHGTLGIGLALTIPNPVFSIKPWVAPRLDAVRNKETGGAVVGSETNTDTNFGVSGGVDLGFLNGLTVRAMYDRVMGGDGYHPAVISVGLGLRVGL